MYQAGNDYLYGHVIALMGIMGYVMSQLESGKQIHGFQLLEQIEQIEQTILKSSHDPCTGWPRASCNITSEVSPRLGSGHHR